MRRPHGVLAWVEFAAALRRASGTSSALFDRLLVSPSGVTVPTLASRNDPTLHRPWLVRAESVVALSACVWAAIVHVVVFLNAGALWRDEANSYNQAAMGTLADAWRRMEFESFPILWCLVLRGWLGAGLDSDVSLRALGLIVGLGTLAMFWWNSRVFRSGLPLLSLTLAALAPALVWYGDSLRAYGLGMVLILWVTGSVWRVAENPSAARIALAGAAAILAIHCLYYNIVHLFVIGGGAALVCAWRRRWKAGGAVLAIGGICAASMLAYLPSTNRRSEWVIIIQDSIGLKWLAGRFVDTLELAGVWMPWVWAGLGAAALAACIHLWLRRESSAARGPADQAVFWAWIVAGGLVCHFLFLSSLRFPTQHWYYVTLIAILGLAIDAATGQWARLVRIGRVLRVAVAAALLLVGATKVWTMAQMRATNVDRVVQAMAPASPDDLIVLSAWEVGVSFHRYYRGRTPWITIPDITDHTLHRYDLYKQKMGTPEAIAPELQKIRQTLVGGHRVWLVGMVHLLPPEMRLISLPPAPHPQTGWQMETYRRYWLAQSGQTLQELASRGARVTDGYSDQPINSFENLPLAIIEGQR
jgi:hypothetical protein